MFNSLTSRACGKSSLTIRLTDDRFSDIHDVTIAAEIGSKIVNVGNGQHIKLQIWDTVSRDSDIILYLYQDLIQAGQEHFRAVTRSYFRNAAGCLLVYDVTRRETFLHIQSWFDDIREQADPEISICLVGNKSDLGATQRQVSLAEASQWAEANGVLNFVETSAKTGDNVLEAYLQVANNIHDKIIHGHLDVNDKSHGIKVNRNSTGLINLSMDANADIKKSKGCC